VAARALSASAAGTTPGGLLWQVLHPGPAGESPAALAVRFARGTDSLLVAGLATPALEAAVLARPISPAARAVVITDRADTNAFSEAWLQAVQPRRLLLPAGAEGASADDSLPARLGRRGIRMTALPPGQVETIRFQN
jgi:hypothetical protein